MSDRYIGDLEAAPAVDFDDHLVVETSAKVAQRATPAQVLAAARPSPYHYRQSPALVAPAITGSTPEGERTISAAGEGWTHVLLGPTEMPGGILAGRDFVSAYEGHIYVDVSAGAQLEIDLTATHMYTVSGAAVDFASTRTEHVRVKANDYITIPLVGFSSRYQLRLGEVATRDGSTIAVDAAVLATPVTLTLELRLRGYGITGPRDADNRAQVILTELTGEQLGVVYYQLA